MTSLSDLIHSSGPKQGKFNINEQRLWAGRLCENIGVRPLTQQPGLMEDALGYAKLLASKGLPPRFVIYEGPVHLNPVQVMDFPLDRGLEIMKLGRKLFASISRDLFGAKWLNSLTILLGGSLH